jgi:2-keto-3-deoxy-L-rhamnonate aldolase RhmA
VSDGYGGAAVAAAVPAGRGGSDLVHALKRGPVVGTFQVMPGPAVTEILVLAGADVVCLDAEHAALDIASLEHHVRAAESVGAWVRLGKCIFNELLNVLSAGQHGLGCRDKNRNLF